MKKKKTILIVDDEEIIISCIQTFLDGLGYEFISATSGQQALDVLSSQSVDLVLLDVMMPGLDGFAVCKRIKENPRTKNIPVLMVTALKEIEDRIMSMEVGADDFLPKPLEETELQIRVKSLLRIKSYNDELSKSLAELQDKNDRLEHLEELKNDLIHMIVHDLKGPLTLIMVNLDLLSVEQDEISPQKLDRLKSATKHCQELQEMIDEILMIAIMEEDKMTLSLASAHLETLTNYVLDSFSKGIKEKNITVYLAADPTVPELMLDQPLIRRVIFNLADNALRHTTDEGKIDITISLSGDGNKVTWSIWNSGQGIPKSIHEKIFQKFEQAAAKKIGFMTGKSGLGLPFSKMAVEAHGGNLWLESNGDTQGARFTFTLPVNR